MKRKERLLVVDGWSLEAGDWSLVVGVGGSSATSVAGMGVSVGSGVAVGTAVSVGSGVASVTAVSVGTGVAGGMGVSVASSNVVNTDVPSSLLAITAVGVTVSSAVRAVNAI